MSMMHSSKKINLKKKDLNNVSLSLSKICLLLVHGVQIWISIWLKHIPSPPREITSSVPLSGVRVFKFNANKIISHISKSKNKMNIPQC